MGSLPDLGAWAAGVADSPQQAISFLAHHYEVTASSSGLHSYLMAYAPPGTLFRCCNIVLMHETNAQHQHLNEPVPSLREHCPTLSPRVEAVLLKALAKKAAARYLSVHAFAEALRVASTSTIGTRLVVYRGHNDAPGSCCAWSSDSTRLATGGSNGLLKIWNALTNQLILTCEDHSVAEINDVAWSPDGTRLASASDDKVVRIWEAGSGQLLSTFRGHADHVRAIAWSPDGTKLASASHDKTVQVWDVNSERLLYTYSGHTNWVSAVAWSPDGTKLASASVDGTVQIWEASSGRHLYTYSDYATIALTVAWSPDRLQLVSGAVNGVMVVWQAVS